MCVESRYPDQLDFDTDRNTLQSLLLRDSLGVLLQVPDGRHIALEARVPTAHVRHELLARTRLDRNDQRLKDEELGRCLKAFYGVYTNDTQPGSGFMITDKWSHIQAFIHARVEPGFWGAEQRQPDVGVRRLQCSRLVRAAMRLDRSQSRPYFYGLLDTGMVVAAWNLIKDCGDARLLYQPLEPALPTAQLCRTMLGREGEQQQQPPPKVVLAQLENRQDERLQRAELGHVAEGIMEYMQLDAQPGANRAGGSATT